MPTAERTDQKHRTRQDLLQAAARLLQQGRVPKLAEVAKEAMVSRATAYRYFSSDEALLAEAPLDALVPSPEHLFAQDASADPVARILKADRALREQVWANQQQFRLMLARLLDQAASAHGNPAASRNSCSGS